jgi:hypothetical protein
MIANLDPISGLHSQNPRNTERPSIYYRFCRNPEASAVSRHNPEHFVPRLVDKVLMTTSLSNNRRHMI